MLKIAFVDGGHLCQKLVFSLLSDEYECVIDQNSPDLLVYSLYGNSHLKYNCKKLQVIGENSFPNFNECDYAISPHYIDFDRHCRIPFYAFTKEYKMICNGYIENMDDRSALSRNFCCALITNNLNADPRRLQLAKQLDLVKHIDSFGKAMNNTGKFITSRPQFAENLDTKYTNPEKIQLCHRYRFTLALENSSVEGYHTEKITDAFAAYSVPIYWGHSSINNEFDQHSFIDASQYNSLEEMIDKVINMNDNEYLAMLKHQPKCLHLDYYEKLKDFLLYVVNGQCYEHRYGNFANRTKDN